MPFNSAEKRKVYSHKYYEKNKEDILAKARKYQKENKEAIKKQHKEYVKKNKEKVYLIQKKYRQSHKEQGNKNSRVFQKKLKELIFSHYGKTCVCCGESNIEFLSIDHIDGKGNQHRKEIRRNSGPNFYYWLKINHFPKGFRTLCLNCNFSFGHFGYCPHQKEKQCEL